MTMIFTAHLKTSVWLLSFVKPRSCLHDVHLSTRRLYVTVTFRRNKIQFSFLLRNSLSAEKVKLVKENELFLQPERDRWRSKAGDGRTLSIDVKLPSDVCRASKINRGHYEAVSSQNQNGNYNQLDFVQRHKIKPEGHQNKRPSLIKLKPCGYGTFRGQTGRLQNKCPVCMDVSKNGVASVGQTWSYHPRILLHTAARYTCRSKSEDVTWPKHREGNTSKNILNQVSQVVRNPDWHKEIRATILKSSGLGSMEYVDSVVLPSIARYMEDETLVKESLMVLLLAKMAGVSQGSTAETSTPLERQLSLAIVLMLIRIGLRVHYSVDNLQPADISSSERISIVKMGVLVGDLVEAAVFATISRLQVPEIVGILFEAVSDVITNSFVLATKICEGQERSQSSVETQPSTTMFESEDTLYPWEDTPSLLGATCESAVLVSGQGSSLRDAARLFGHYISLARCTPLPSTLDDEGSLSLRRQYFETARESLAAFPASPEKKLMVLLAKDYIGGLNI